jgi:hypothetical protein
MCETRRNVTPISKSLAAIKEHNLPLVFILPIYFDALNVMTHRHSGDQTARLSP